jgi:hypothetical protein
MTHEGKYVGVFEGPPSHVKDIHPAAKAGEFYASCQHRKNDDAFWTLGPFSSRDEARDAVCTEAIRRDDDGVLGTFEVIDERIFQTNKAGQEILNAIYRVSEEDAKLCFEWALEIKRRRSAT